MQNTDHPLLERLGTRVRALRAEQGLTRRQLANSSGLSERFVAELEVGTVNLWEVPGYRIEMSPFGGIKDSGLGYKEGVVEAMKSFTNVKTWSMPWSA